MFETYINITAIFFIAAGGISFVVLPLLLMVQYYIHKKLLDPTYYNTEHFSENELVVFTSGFIFYLYKTILYARAIALPKTMKTRFKEDILTFNDHPFVYLSACFTMLLIVYCGLAVINLFVFFGFWEYYN